MLTRKDPLGWHYYVVRGRWNALGKAGLFLLVLGMAADIRALRAVIRVYDGAGNMIETHEQALASSGDFWFHR